MVKHHAQLKLSFSILQSHRVPRAAREGKSHSLECLNFSLATNSKLSIRFNPNLLALSTQKHVPSLFKRIWHVGKLQQFRVARQEHV